MTIKVTEEMRQAGLHQHQVEVESFEEFEFPGQVKPSWEEISKELDKLLTPKEEQSQ